MRIEICFFPRYEIDHAGREPERARLRYLLGLDVPRDGPVCSHRQDQGQDLNRFSMCHSATDDRFDVLGYRRPGPVNTRKLGSLEASRKLRAIVFYK